MNRPLRFGVLAVNALITLGLPQPGHSQSSDERQVWISTESALLGRPVDLALASDGSLFVLDQMNAQVFVLTEPNRVHLTVGREGGGPSEFKSPSALALVPGGFDVLDNGNGRVQRFDNAGQYVSGRPLPPLAQVYPAGLSPDGHVAVNTMADSTLVAVYDIEGERVARFGVPPARMPAIVSMSAIRREVRRGSVPGLFRNTVLPRFGPRGSIWLSLPTDGGIQRWSREGSLEASHTLDEPELDAIRTAFFDRYKDPDMRGILVLRYIADVYPTESGAWVLLNREDDEAAVVIHVSPEGVRTNRWTLPAASGASLLAVDETRAKAYFVIRSTAEVIEVALHR